MLSLRLLGLTLVESVSSVDGAVSEVCQNEGWDTPIYGLFWLLPIEASNYANKFLDNLILEGFYQSRSFALVASDSASDRLLIID